MTQVSPTASTELRFPEEALPSVARFIIGDEVAATKSRGTFGIRRLFERCGVIVMQYAGQPKEEWTTQLLREQSEAQLMSVLGRLVSAEENGNENVARAAFDQLNAQLLEFNIQLVNANSHISIVAVESSLRPVGQPNATIGGLADPNFEQLDISEDEACRLGIAWDEAVRCYSAGAYLAAMIMLGSLLEAVLMLALKRNRNRITSAGIRFLDNKNQPKPVEKWSLGEMIQAAGRLAWTTQKLTAFAHSLREYRNYVHPELRHRLAELPKSHECLIGSLVVSGAVNDLKFAINSAQEKQE